MELGGPKTRRRIANVVPMAAANKANIMKSRGNEMACFY